MLKNKHMWFVVTLIPILHNLHSLPEVCLTVKPVPSTPQGLDLYTVKSSMSTIGAATVTERMYNETNFIKG